MGRDVTCTSKPNYSRNLVTKHNSILTAAWYWSLTGNCGASSACLDWLPIIPVSICPTILERSLLQGHWGVTESPEVAEMYIFPASQHHTGVCGCSDWWLGDWCMCVVDKWIPLLLGKHHCYQILAFPVMLNVCRAFQCRQMEQGSKHYESTLRNIKEWFSPFLQHIQHSCSFQR